MTLPFFEAPLDVELGINLDGSFAVKLAGENGLLTLVKTGILELQVEVAFARTGDTFTALLSGKIKPLVAGLDWPSFDVRELSIDSDGTSSWKADGSTCETATRSIFTDSRSRSARWASARTRMAANGSASPEP